MDARSSDEMRRQAPVTDQHRELATQAMQEFERGAFSQCSTSMGRLGSERATDVKVIHNRSVAIFYQTNCKAVDEFKHNIQTVFNMAKISPDLSEKSNLDDADYAVVYYNKAVLLWHEKQHRSALSILEKLFKYIEPIDEGLALKVMVLLTELYLIVHQPYEAMNMVQNIEKFLSGKSQQDKEKTDTHSAAHQDAVKARLMLCKVRCNLMAKQLTNKTEFKKLQGNSHPVNYAKAYHMYLKGNAKKASKMLGSLPSAQLSHNTGECLALMYANNQAVLNASLRRPSLAICQMRDALQYNDKIVRESVPNEKSKAKPTLQWSYVSQHYILLHNLGVLQLHSKRPAAAFECFVECVQVFHRNPRLWLRLAECCIMHHRENNDADRQHQHKLNVVQASLGSGFHHKLVLGQGTAAHTKGSSSNSVFPNLNLGFASFCLHNARALLPTDPQDVQAPTPDEQAEFSSPSPMPALLSAEPSNPLRETEVANLRCSILCSSAYVALCEQEFYKALGFCKDLLRQPNLSPAQKYLGHMYKGEALVAMDRIADGLDELNPDHVTDVSATLPQQLVDADKEQEEVPPLAPLVAWLPGNPAVARALMQYNLAVAYSVRTEYQRALKALTESSERVGVPFPVQMFYLKLYLDLKQGNKKGAINLINEHFGYTPKIQN